MSNYWQIFIDRGHWRIEPAKSALCSSPPARQSCMIKEIASCPTKVRKVKTNMGHERIYFFPFLSPRERIAKIHTKRRRNVAIFPFPGLFWTASWTIGTGKVFNNGWRLRAMGWDMPKLSVLRLLKLSIVQAAQGFKECIIISQFERTDWPDPLISCYLQNESMFCF